jgi:hypothetical protein
VKLLQQVQRGRGARPPRLVLYGTEGIGKSTFAAGAPSPIFIQTEDGLDGIDTTKFPLAARYEDTAQALDELLHEEHAFETVVIDSLDWLERLIWDKTCREANAVSIERVDGGYGKGYLTALQYWREILAKLDALRDHKGMATILIAHAKVERFEDPEASAYDRYAPRLHKLAAALVCEWCDAVLFATRKFRTQVEDAGFSRKRAVAHAVGKAGGDRILRCVGSPACVAKNRFGIIDELPLSWAAFVAALCSTVPSSPAAPTSKEN